MCVGALHLQDKVSPLQWMLRKQGYAGAADPLADKMRDVLRKGPGGDKLLPETRTEKRMNMNRTDKAQLGLQSRFTGQSAHSANINTAINERGSV